MSIEIKLEKDVDPVEWNSVLNKSGYSLFQSYEWSTLDDFLFLTARENGKLCGGCLFNIKKILGMKTFIIRASPFGLNKQIALCLVKRIKNSNVPIKFIKMRFSEMTGENVFRSAGFASSPEATYVIDLKRNENEIWKSLSKSAKREIKKARNYQFEIKEIENKEDLHFIYEHYADKCKRCGSKPRPFSFFVKLYENIIQKGLGEILLLKMNGEIVSSNVMLFNGVTCESILSPTNKEFLKFHVNYLLTWESILRAKNRAFNYFDFLCYNLFTREGSIRADDNVFKSKWGGRIILFNSFFNLIPLVFFHRLMRKYDYLQPFFYKLSSFTV